MCKLFISISLYHNARKSRGSVAGDCERGSVRCGVGPEAHRDMGVRVRRKAFRGAGRLRPMVLAWLQFRLVAPHGEHRRWTGPPCFRP